jgi:hypothetical protein
MKRIKKTIERKITILVGSAAIATFLLISALLLNVFVAMAHEQPPPGGTEIHIDVNKLPQTIIDAVANLGPTDTLYIGPLVPGMGHHVVVIKNGTFTQPYLLYDNFGKLIGIEFQTRLYPSDPEVLKNKFGIDLNDPSTWPVQVPPWEGPMGPHPGMPPNTIHWDIHIYFKDVSYVGAP